MTLGAQAGGECFTRSTRWASVHEDGGIGIPFFMSSIDGHSKKLKGLSPIPLGGLMGYNFAENVWLEA